MRIEVNVLTGEITEHPSVPGTSKVPVEVVSSTPEPTKAELLAELAVLTAKIEALEE